VQLQGWPDLSNDGQPRHRAAAGDAQFDDAAQLAQLLELAPVGALVRNLETDLITYWNQGAQQLYGWTASEALGKASHTLLQTQFPISKADVDASLRTSGQWSGELVHTRRDGQRVVVASRQVVRRDQLGRAVATLELNTDLSQHNGLESDLRESDERFRLLVEAVQDATAGRVEVAFADQGYNGETAEAAAKTHGVDIVTVRLPEAKRGFVLLPKRWVAERSLAWTTRFRRLVRDYERYASTLAGLHFVAFACLMLKQAALLMASS